MLSTKKVLMGHQHGCSLTLWLVGVREKERQSEEQRGRELWGFVFLRYNMYGKHIYSLAVYAQIHIGVYPGEKLWSITGNQGEVENARQTIITINYSS